MSKVFELLTCRGIMAVDRNKFTIMSYYRRGQIELGLSVTLEGDVGGALQSFARVITFADDVTFVVWSSNIYDLQYNITKCLVKIKAWCEKEAEMKLTDENLLVSTVTAKEELGEDDDTTVTQRLPSLREARTAAEKVLLFLKHSKRATSDDVNLSADLLRRVYAIS
ncbi:hypothetical protein LAZ67_15000468 [Cordylochernes scorpioides]|uniref:Uncharacterized protein n=1 Tax=Cordylochernes scorpioides TaxID=51811 RepID=A0ABY6L842_9ARAC|nr:hypothetical protein LAZ67_15000468 [Cordylochernes scorpioides]